MGWGGGGSLDHQRATGGREGRRPVRDPVWKIQTLLFSHNLLIGHPPLFITPYIVRC